MERARYRLDGQYHCVDVRLKTTRHLFDGRDPAPFRDRDLDDDAIEYIEESVAELPSRAPMKLAFWVAEEPEPKLDPEVIRAAVSAHYTHQQERLSRRIVDYFKRAQLFLVLGFTALVLFLSASELAVSVDDPRLQKILREGLVITGWVAMWRPLEVWLYDWWPLLAEHIHLKRMLRAPVEVFFEPGPKQ